MMKTYLIYDHEKQSFVQDYNDDDILFSNHIAGAMDFNTTRSSFERVEE